MSRNSPCIKVCMMDPDTGLCAGCFRTIEEIGTWSKLSEEEKQVLYQKLERRKRGELP
ncbi:DUF1289 domain-containing protein [Leptospira ryugenii]|uniref:DUF1289 domain-containing protein n=1 Tax=Leptospira ryugenii TaxID=1917863 RepID=UPI000D59379C|nr:DUF1289 domain-containing protein [Leptospira ryugenii]